jgi:hypothetical protein
MFGNQKKVICLQGLTLFSLLMYFRQFGDFLFLPYRISFRRILSPEARSNAYD